MDPWGTPDKTGVHSELDQLTNFLMPASEFPIQCRMFIHQAPGENVWSAKAYVGQNQMPYGNQRRWHTRPIHSLASQTTHGLW